MLKNMKTIEIPAGGMIFDAVKYAKEKAAKLGEDRVYFVFNEIPLSTYVDSRVEDICSLYFVQHELKRLQKIIYGQK